MEIIICPPVGVLVGSNEIMHGAWYTASAGRVDQHTADTRQQETQKREVACSP
jgi:hypothetical protein